MKFLKTTFLFAVSLSVLLFSCKGNEDEEEAKSAEAKMTSFVIKLASGNVTGTINADNTIEFIVPSNTDVKAIVPTISISPKASVLPKSDEAVNFTNPVKFTVTAENGTDKTEYTVSVIPAKIANLNSSVAKTGESVTINGYFAPSNNQVSLVSNNRTVNATITAQNAKSITFSIPSGNITPEGAFNHEAFKVQVKSFDVDIVNPTPNPFIVRVVDVSKPTILSLDKATYMQGDGNIVITGVNLKPAFGRSVKIYIRKIGQGIPSHNITGDVSLDGTTITIKNPSNLAIGYNEIWIDVDQTNAYTNTIAFNTVVNSNPIPTISSLDNLFPKVNVDEVTMTGTNFGTDATAVKIEIWPNGATDPQPIFGTIKEITDTQIKFTIGFIGKVRIKVVRGGQTSEPSNEIDVKP